MQGALSSTISTWPRDADARALLEGIFRSQPVGPFAVRLWDGGEVRFGDPQFTLVFRDSDTFWRLFSSRDPALFADAYVQGQIDLEGDIEAAVRLGSWLRDLPDDTPQNARPELRLAVPESRHTAAEDQRDVRAHYDLPDRFFELFLDRRRVYSCAYYLRPDEPLERAQEHKLDLVCRKLQLQPGERFLDVGCGWGALLIWAAQHYGVEAHGITLSRNQAAFARRRVAEAGLADQVRIDELHYEALPEDAYDKIASIGMYEHVGIPRYPAYFSALRRALRPGGLFLNHGITVMRGSPEKCGGDFIYRYVFPGGELDHIAHTQSVMTEEQFEILDVQSLRPHYALTLHEWLRRFQRREREAAELVPPEIIRTWRLYLAGCARAFEEGIVSVYQVLARTRKGDRTQAGHEAKAQSDESDEAWPLPLSREEQLGHPRG